MEDRYYIKVCGLTDPQNIKKIVDLGVDFIGLIFYPESKRYVGDFVDANYIKSLTGRVNKVGVYVNEDIETVYEDVEDMDLQYVQLHGEETPAYCVKQVIKNNCLSVSQVRELAMLFSIEDDKLEVAKLCYGKTVDFQDYGKLNDIFTFAASGEDLSVYIRSFKR
jgi:phosphoribosylanthranilate isomerase